LISVSERKRSGATVSDEDTWISVFTRETEAQPDAVYAQHGNDVLTYASLRERTDQLATALLELGVRPGQTLAIWSTNSLDFLVAQWATYRLGCVLLPLYSYYRVEELRYALNESRTEILFTTADFAGKVDSLQELDRLLPELAAGGSEFAQCPNLRHVLGLGSISMRGVINIEELIEGTQVNADGLNWIGSRLTPRDLMNVMYTSGTTGVPKAGLSMHGNNLASITHWSALANLRPTDVILTHVPMFTNFGGLYANALALFNGASMQVTQVFDAAESLRLIRELGVTYVPGSPEIFRMLLDHVDFEQTDTSHVHSAHVAGSAIVPELMTRIISELAPNAMQAYGMSECGGVATVTSAADPLQKRLDSVGKPLPSVRIAVVDPDSERSMPVGESGEIWFGDAQPGSCVGKGYLNSPQATAAAITPSGWFRSGDLGFVDHDGYLHFVGRLKNMMTVGGFNVYPAEIARYLMAHPDIEDAHVVAIPDDRLGSVPVAFVVKSDESDLDPAGVIAYMRERVSSQKQPRKVWLIQRSEIPMTPSGKIAIVELEQRALTLSQSS
jgi:acyl-CoA synthetase (AMP-forming)/AMP-acid ligase II